MIFVAGGTGFIGRHLLRALKKAGHEARCLVHNPARTGVCTGLGFGTVRGNVMDRGSLGGAIDGARTVAHLVGIIEESGAQTFQDIHVRGTENLLEEARKAGVEHFIYVSAIGADPGSPYPYQRTKARAEEAVKASGIAYTIFRPSLVIGPGGGFVGKMLDIVGMPGPFIPVPGGGESLFQPVFVEDLARCIIMSVNNPEARGRLYDVGGPEQLTYNRMLEILAGAMGRKKRLLHIPMGLMAPVVKALEKARLSPVSSDQLGLLGKDNICAPDAVKRSFGFEPVTYREAIERSISRPARGS